MAAATEHPVCPKCRLPLRPITHAGVALSFCVECRGLWFDGPEVERVRAELERLEQFITVP